MASGHSPSSQPTNLHRKGEREKLITAPILVVTGVAVAAAGLFSAVALLGRERGKGSWSVCYGASELLQGFSTSLARDPAQKQEVRNPRMR